MKLKPGAPKQVGMSPTRMALARQRMREWVDGGVTPALVTLVARRGTIVLHEALGRFGPEPDARPLDVSAIFPIASVAKVIGATAIMMLVEDGLVGLNRPLQEYLPEFTGEGKEHVMVHHVLTHTSGLVDNDVVEHEKRKRAAGVTIPPPDPTEHPMLHDLWWLRIDAPLTRKPGVQMSYSGAGGFGLIAEIVRRITRKNFGEFAAERIFEPLGMRDTFFKLPPELHERFVRRSSDLHDQMEDPSTADRPSSSVGGYSTAQDMAVFCQMFLDRGRYGETRILSPATVFEMTRNQIPGIPSQFKEDYEREGSRGYGWDVKGEKKPRFHGSLDSPRAFTHQGAGGVSIMVDPAYDLVVVFLSVSRGIMSPDLYAPKWTMDLFTNLVIAAIDDV